MTTTAGEQRRERVLSPAYAATTVGMFSLIAFVAFEAMAITTVMPTIARDLTGFGLYAMAFAAPLASGVVGMVAAGMWSDRRDPVLPLFAAMATFSFGLVVCGVAPSMEVLVVGRVVQGLGGGALIVSIYVLVGLIYPAALQPSLFASFAAAWVLPALFGPALAAYVAAVLSWRWVFLGAVVLVAGSAALVAPALRARDLSRAPGTGTPVPRSRLLWASLAAAGVLALDLLGSSDGVLALGALVAAVLVFVGLRHLLPTGTLVARRGLPAVIGTRGLLSATFFSTEAYIVYVLQEHWGLTPGQAGIALTCVGIVWASASFAQSRLGDRIAHETAMRVGTAVVLTGVALVTVAVVLQVGGTDLPALAPIVAYVGASIGMGFAYPRTSVAMLAATSDARRGFNSSALNVSDSLGGALALAMCGIGYAAAQRSGVDPFPVVYVLSSVLGVLGVVVAARTRVGGPTAG